MQLRQRVQGLAGPSGCGKSTLAKVLAMLLRPDGGTVRIDGATTSGWRHRAPRALRTAVGLVFQEPRTAVDPRLTLAAIIVEPLAATGRRAEAAGRLDDLVAQDGLTDELLGRRPHEVSAGQFQRACLARALALQPRYLICDEMTSMLDASTAARLVATVETYRQHHDAGVLAISHDRPLLERWCATTHDWDQLG